MSVNSQKQKEYQEQAKAMEEWNRINQATSDSTKHDWRTTPIVNKLLNTNEEKRK